MVKCLICGKEVSDLNQHFTESPACLRKAKKVMRDMAQWLYTLAGTIRGEE